MAKSEVRGRILKGKKTKQLLLDAPQKHLYLLQHADLDEMAALSLIDAKAKAVINAAPYMTGQYPTKGARLLLEAGIPLFQIHTEAFNEIPDLAMVRIREKQIVVERSFSIPCKPFTLEDWHFWTQRAKKNLPNQLSRFIDNTLHYAGEEKSFILEPLRLPELHVSIEGRHAVIVVRGSGYKEDLAALKSYIEDYKPVLIGVDGGADALLDVHYKPSLIVGDMDSVSDRALKSGAEIVVHAYPNGNAPGMQRIHDLGLHAEQIPAPGTSEDLAMLIAYERKAELIVTVGTHTHMIDFLEKGRAGMGSTLLVRLKLGAKLLDAKGVSKLYQRGIRWNRWLYVPAAAVFPLAVLSFIHPGFRQFISTIWLYVKFSLFNV